MSTHISEVLKRIDEMRRKLGWSDRKLSLMAGKSGDLIRNMRRQAEAKEGTGKRTSARTDSFEAIAGALGVSSEWLITGFGPQKLEPTAGSTEKTTCEGVREISVDIVDGRMRISADVDIAGLEELERKVAAARVLLQ